MLNNVFKANSIVVVNGEIYIFFLGCIQQASEHVLGSIPNFKLCACPLNQRYLHSAKQCIESK